MALNVSVFDLTEENILQLSSDNSDLRLELSAAKELIVMSPADTMTGWRSGQVGAQLHTWAGLDGTAIAFGSSAGFTLPNGAIRAPYAPGFRYRGGNHCPVESRKGSDTVALIS